MQEPVKSSERDSCFRSNSPEGKSLEETGRGAEKTCQGPMAATGGLPVGCDVDVVDVDVVGVCYHVLDLHGV
eukprot:340627-Hanusia_phi.AAC.2